MLIVNLLTKNVDNDIDELNNTSIIMSLLHHIDDKNQLFLFQKTKSIVIFTSIFLSLFINAACVKLNTKKQ